VAETLNSMPTTTSSPEVTKPDVPAWVGSLLVPRALLADQDDWIDSEVAFETPTAQPTTRGLPENPYEVARAAGAPPEQLRKAKEMERRGLSLKAKRQALCGVLGVKQDCSNTACRERLYTPFRCKCRYCMTCARSAYSQLFRKYVGLRPVAERILSSRSRRQVTAKLDFTCLNLGRMPTRDEVRSFNGCIKRFCRILERELGISRKDYGLVYCDEFGGDNNTNLHAHGVYVGPWLPRPKAKGSNKLGKLGRWWQESCQGTAFAGTFIISVKYVKSFEAGLAHALKYAGKFLSNDPVRLAELELAFHGVRRVHTLAAFYKGLPKAESEEACAPSCPTCGSALLSSGGWIPAIVLKREGRRPLDEARREAGRKRILELSG
jgi:hypothetical protein